MLYVGGEWQAGSAAFIIAAFKGEPLPKAVRTPQDPEWVELKAKGAPKEARDQACAVTKIC
jgi:hypothetical protein